MALCLSLMTKVLSSCSIEQNNGVEKSEAFVNFFGKSNDQSDACINYGMTRKSAFVNFL